jgi:hypothetical protein
MRDLWGFRDVSVKDGRMRFTNCERGGASRCLGLLHKSADWLGK